MAEDDLLEKVATTTTGTGRIRLDFVRDEAGQATPEASVEAT